MATGALDLYSLLYNLLTVVGLAGMYAILALLGVLFMWFSKPFFFKPVTYHFDHWGIHLEGEGYTGSLPWRKISKGEEKQNAFILYEANIPSFTIDKKNFESEEPVQAFAQLLRSQLTR